MSCCLLGNQLGIGYDQEIILQDVNLSFPRPEIVSIIGPNGSGKSTLLKGLGRLLTPKCGVVMLDGENIHKMSGTNLARKIAVLPQSAHAPGDMLVYDLVSCGRTPYRGGFRDLSQEDKDIITQAIIDTGLEGLAYRPLDKLSGGERQRAWLAMALTQQPEILLLDEPTTYLDIHHQLELMQLIEQLYVKKQITVIMVLHDLNHAARFSQRMITVKQGRVVSDGRVKDVLTTENLRHWFQVETRIIPIEQSGTMHLVCIPLDVCKTL